MWSPPAPSATAWCGWCAASCASAAESIRDADAIAHRAHRLDALAGVAQLAPQPLDVRLDGAGVGVERIVPHAAQQLLARAHLAFALDEELEQAELEQRQR